MRVHPQGGDEEEESKEKLPQARLESVWNSLQMPDSQRLDMAIKYSCGEFFAKLMEVRECAPVVPGWDPGGGGGGGGGTSHGVNLFIAVHAAPSRKKTTNRSASFEIIRAFPLLCMST